MPKIMRPITGPEGEQDYLLDSARSSSDIVAYVREALEMAKTRAERRSLFQRFAALGPLFALALAACGGDPSGSGNPDDDDTPPGDRMEDPSPEDDAKTVTPGDGGPGPDPDALPGTPGTPELMIESYSFTVGPDSPGAEVNGRVDDMTSHVEGQEVDEEGNPKSSTFNLTVEGTGDSRTFTFTVPPGERCRFRSVSSAGTVSPFTDVVTVNVDREAVAPDLSESPEDQWLDLAEDPAFSFTDIPGDTVSVEAYLNGELMETIPAEGRTEFDWTYDADDDENMQGTWSFGTIDRFRTRTPVAARRETVRNYYAPTLSELNLDCSSTIECLAGGATYPLTFNAGNATTFEIEIEDVDPYGTRPTVDPASGSIADICDESGQCRVNLTTGNAGGDRVGWNVVIRLLGHGGEVSDILPIAYY